MVGLFFLQSWDMSCTDRHGLYPFCSSVTPSTTAHVVFSVWRSGGLAYGCSISSGGGFSVPLYIAGSLARN